MLRSGTRLVQTSPNVALFNGLSLRKCFDWKRASSGEIGVTVERELR